MPDGSRLNLWIKAAPLDESVAVRLLLVDDGLDDSAVEDKAPPRHDSHERDVTEARQSRLGEGKVDDAFVAALRLKWREEEDSSPCFDMIALRTLSPHAYSAEEGGISIS
jgi:hypothetical protein